MNKQTYKQIRRNVMRRVYTLYVARIVSHPLMLYVGLFGSALALFAQNVHVAKVIENFSSNSVAGAPQFILHAIMRGEVLTLVAIGLMVFAALSIQVQVRHLFVPKLRLV